MLEIVLKISSYGSVEHAAKDALYKTILDPTCTAYRIEDIRIKVQKWVEECKIPPKQRWWTVQAQWDEAMAEHKQHVRDFIKQYWSDTAKAHEESLAAASIMRLLSDEVDGQTYIALLNAAMRPLIMMEVPQMASQWMQMKLKRERQEKAENLCNQSIKQIIKEQNIPFPVER